MNSWLPLNHIYPLKPFHRNPDESFMSRCHHYELTNIETKYLQPHESPMVVTSGYYLFKKKKKREREREHNEQRHQ